MLRLLVLFGLAAGPAAADIFTFITPSGNIACSVGMEAHGSDVQCIIFERQGPPATPRPANCPGPWGHHFFMTDRGPVIMGCGAPGSARSFAGSEVAQYGVTGSFGDIVCHSAREGFSCRNGDGHGFFLSRARQSAF